MIHYQIERDTEGKPTSLCWSPDIQNHMETMQAKRIAAEKSLRNQINRPIGCYVEWAKKHGIWKEQP